MSETLTERPKPKPFVPQKSAPSTPSSDTKVESEQPVVKKPFVRKPHLTDRPFKNESLQALRDSMQPKRNKRN